MTSESATDGTYVGGPLLGGTGAAGASAQLDGVDDGVTVPDSALLEGMSSLAVAAVVRVDALPSANSELVGKDGSDAGDYSYRLVLAANGSVQFVVQTTSNSWYSADTVVASAPGTLAPSAVWRSIVSTYDGNQVRIHVDGVLVGTGSKAIGGTVTGSSAPPRAGISAASGFTPFRDRSMMLPCDGMRTLNEHFQCAYHH